MGNSREPFGRREAVVSDIAQCSGVLHPELPHDMLQIRSPGQVPKASNDRCYNASDRPDRHLYPLKHLDFGHGKLRLQQKLGVQAAPSIRVGCELFAFRL